MEPAPLRTGLFNTQESVIQSQSWAEWYSKLAVKPALDPPGNSTLFLRGDDTWAVPSGVIPGPHANTHVAAGSDPLANISQSQITNLVSDLANKVDAVGGAPLTLSGTTITFNHDATLLLSGNDLYVANDAHTHNTQYLSLSGNTANQTINIGAEDITTTGDLTCNTLNYSSLNPPVAATPGGNDTEVQYNDSGNFGADTNLTYDKAGNLTLGTSVSVGTNYKIGGTSVLDISGANNVHVGGGTGTSGTRCVVVGNQAAINITSTANDNVFIGYRSGATANTADQNVGIGSNACYNAGIGGGLTGIGYNALASTSGVYNTGVGCQVGLQVSTGIYNCLMGFQTGYTIANKSYNTLYGSKAGRYCTGSNNVEIGYECGYAGGSGNGNVLIGYQVLRTSPAANTLAIDNSSTTSPLVHGNFANNTLQVNGDFTANGNATVNSDLSVAGNATIDKDFTTKQKVIVNTTRATSSPYNVAATDHIVFVDTDSANITVNLPAGEGGRHLRFINTGSSTNIVTLVPNGAELLVGNNANFTLNDAEILNVYYESTEGWW